MRVLQLLGIGDDDEIRIVQTHTGHNLTPLYFIDGCIPLDKYIVDKDIFTDTILCGGGEMKGVKIARPDIVINGICDPDTHKKSLEDAKNIISALNVPSINHPDLIMETRRDRISELLREIEGARIPKTVRIRPKGISEIEESAKANGFSFPLLFRPAGGQAGTGLLKLDSESDFEKLERFAFDGREYFLIELIDFVSSDGLYRKERFFLIGGKVFPGHMMVSHNWQIHEDISSEKRFKLEEKSFLSKWDRGVIPIFEKISELVKLDFFGIDCAHDKKGNLVIFEVNSCMDIFSEEKRTNYYNPKYKKRVAEAITEMVKRKAEHTK